MTLLDDRPDSVNRLIRAGKTYTLDLTFEDSLAGRTFTSTLDDEALGLDVVGAIMTVTASAVLTGALTTGVAVQWQLLEEIDGTPEPILLGTWTPDDGPRAGTSSTVTVSAAASQVTVSVPGAGAVAALAARVTTAEGDIDDLEAADTTHLADDTAHGDPLGALATHEADDTAHGDPLGALSTHEASTTAHGDPLAQLSTHESDITAHGDPLGALQLHRDTLHIPHVTVPAAWGQNRWLTARDEAGTRQVKVHLLGDSIFQGVGASDPRNLGCAQLITDELHDLYGDGGTGWLPAALSATSTGTWTSGMGMGGCQLRATAAATRGFTGLMGSAIRIFHRNANITGAFRWRVNGGGYTTATTPTGFGQDPGAVEITPGGAGPHTLDVEWVSGTVDLFGVEATYPTGIVSYRFAQSGRAASDFTPGIERKITRVSASGAVTTLTCAAPGSFTDDLVGKFVHGPAQIAPGTNGGGVTVTAVASATSLTLSAATTGSFSGQTVTFSTGGTVGVLGANMVADPFLAAAVGRPDLVIIQLGANDPAGSNNSADTFRAGMSKIMRLYSTGDSVDYAPDFVLVIEHIGNWFDIESEYAAVCAVVADLAGGNGAAVVDIWGIGHRSHDYWDDLGYFADTIHPSTAGHVQYAAPVIALLTGN